MGNQIEVNSTTDLDTLIEKSKTQKEQKATYFILSALFPPFTIYLALYLSFRKNLLYKTLPYLLIFYSAVVLVFNIVGLIAVKPPSQATSLGVTFDSKLNSQILLWTILTTIIAFVCFIAGYYYRNKARKNSSLDSNSLWILFLFLNLLIFGVIFLMWKEVSLVSSSISPVINSGYEGL